MGTIGIGVGVWVRFSGTAVKSLSAKIQPLTHCWNDTVANCQVSVSMFYSTRYTISSTTKLGERAVERDAHNVSRKILASTARMSS